MHQMREDQCIYTNRGTQDAQEYHHEKAGCLGRFRQHFRSRRQTKKHAKIFNWWNLFAIIGIISVIIQGIRYLLVPLLVYLNVLSGGVL